MRKFASAIWNLSFGEFIFVGFLLILLASGAAWVVRTATGTLPAPTPKQDCSRLHNPSDDLSADASRTDQNNAVVDQIVQYQQCVAAGGTP